MAHCIDKDYFFASRDVSVWHDIMKAGIDRDRTYTAAEMYGHMPVHLELARILPILDDGTELHGLIEEKKMIVSYDLSSPDPEYKQFGVVGEDYRLVTHKLASQLWDEHVGQPVRTMGMLYDGAACFMSCQLESFDVKGEQVDNNLVYTNWAREGMASLAMVTSVTPVCANTVAWGEQVATDKLRLIHDATIIQRTGEWLNGMVNRANVALVNIREAADILAGARVDNEKIVTTLMAAYPTPAEPVNDCPPDVFAERFGKYELSVERIKELRQDAAELFLGKGTGMDLPSRAGTMWGVVSAVSELENYRRGKNKGQSVLVGSRGDTIARAVTTAMQLSAN